MQRSAAPLLVGILVLAGCGRHGTAVEIGARNEVLHIGNKDEPADLDPHINSANSTGTILGSLFQGLVALSNDGQTILPGMADRWEVSGDGLTYTFHLRDGARWSNGAPLGARDFLDSFLRVLDPQVGCEDAGYLFAVRGARAFLEGRSSDPSTVGLSAPDPRTFVIRLEHPAPYLMVLLTNFPLYPLYMPSLDAAGGRRQRGGAWTRPGALVCNGPFLLKEWRPNAYIRVERNPSFWDAGRVRLREVWFYPTDDENAEERAFRAGQLHVTARLPKTKVAVYEAEHPAELHLLPTNRTSYLTFNVSRAPFTDPRVRRAFSCAIDREKLVQAALGRLGTPAHSLVRPGLGGFEPRSRFDFDPAGARRLLGEAGYPGGAGLPPVEFTLNGNTGVTVAVAEVLQQMWAQNLGVRVTVLPVEFKVYLSTLREKQFQVLLDSWFSAPDPHDILELLVTGDPNNDAGASNRAYDRAVGASDAAPDGAGRWAAFDKAEAINSEEVFYAPIYFSNQGILVHPSVRGWRDNGSAWIDWREIYLEP